MKRRNFIKGVGLTTVGVMAGGSLFASVFKRAEFKVIEIESPNVHVRHGFFNLQVANQNGLQIRRDVFNENGLEQISEDRLVSIKISDFEKDIFGILDKKGFNSKSSKITAVKLRSTEDTIINVDSSLNLELLL